MQIVIETKDVNIEKINGKMYANLVGLYECTLLPKGHGDLIDRNDLLIYTDINRSAYIPVINRYNIITAQTIIPADKGE